MTCPFYVFVHGWGFAADLWEAVRAALPAGDGMAVDLGFFGPTVMPSLPSGRSIVAVGHSFGVLWLLHEKAFRWDGLVSISGFPRFAEGADYAPATPRRVLDRMITRFDTAPLTVLREFRGRCGCEAEAPDPDIDRLGEALRALRDWDARPAMGAPLLALAGRRDPIVPPAMTEQAFASRPGVALDWNEDGRHLLPLTAPEWCAERIAAFAARLGPLP